MAKIKVSTAMPLFLTLGLLTVCQTAHRATSEPKPINMGRICALVRDGSKLANVNSCDTFYTCSSGKAVLENCDPSYYFDKDVQQCVPQGQVNCLNDGDDPCDDRDIGTFAPVPGSCTDYYYCSKTGPLRGSCPDGENFNPTTESCDYETDYPCGSTSTSGCGDTSPKVNLCTFIQNGIYFGSPSKCDVWNFCENNKLSSGSCGKDLVFNVDIGLCDYKSNWKCSQVSKGPGLGPGMDENCGSKPCKRKGERTQANTCSSYYECDGAEYQLKRCPSQLFYDIISKTCVNRLDARNDCDRCAGTSLTFVNEYSTKSCTGYLVCKNGVATSRGDCSGSYFDEVLGGCSVGPEPKYGCCNPNVYGSGPATITQPTTTQRTTTKPTTTQQTTTQPTTTKTTTTQQTTTQQTTTQTTTNQPTTTQRATTQSTTVQ